MSHEIADFETDVTERSRSLPVLVDFWAEWCGPCRLLGPVLERLAEESAGRWALAKVDTERHPELAKRYGIMSIPNVKLFVDGEVADEFLGALPEPEVRRWLERALPSPHAEALAEARAMLARGEYSPAAERLRAVLAAEPRNAGARVALGEALLHLAPETVAETVSAVLDDPQVGEKAEALETLARVVGLAGRPSELPEHGARARMTAAAQSIHSGDYGPALEALVDVLGQDREYAGGIAREAGRAIFVLLGMHHPIAERHHRAFAGALHA